MVISGEKVVSFQRWGGPLLSVLVLCLALWGVSKVADEVTYHEVSGYVLGLEGRKVLQVILLTALSYCLMVLYDLNALAAIGRRLPHAQVGLISFVSFALSNTLGMALLVSSSIRYRFYIEAGLSPQDVAKVIWHCSVSMWLGLCTLVGLALLFASLPPTLPLAAWSHAIGALLTLMPLLWLFGGRLWPTPMPLWRWRIRMPTASRAAIQIAIGATDWALAGAVLYLMMPSESSVGVVYFLVIFAVAQMVGLISYVPGGIGVFEAIVLAGYRAAGDAGLEAPILGALVAYRLFYYFIPLLVAALLILTRTLRDLRNNTLAPWLAQLLPPFFATFTLVAGSMLLLSGASSELHDRMDILQAILPLPLVEASSFLNSVVGMLLLILARGLLYRLDAAYLLTLILLVIGAMLAMLKGIDYEEAIILGVLAIGLAPHYRLFYRRASLFDLSVSIRWWAVVFAIVACAVWLLFFSYKAVEYRSEMLLEFRFEHGGASRGLRAMLGVLLVALLISLALLMRPTKAKPRLPTELELAKVLPLIKGHSAGKAHLALAGDKSLLFAPQDQAFIMYRVEGRSWIALGDPVGGTPDVRRELVWTFREQCERAGAWPIFYQVRPEDLDLYLETGMNLLKLGEEARVRLKDFNLDGKSKRILRYRHNLLTRAGLRLQIIPSADVPVLLPRLKVISDAWLREKKIREKTFSLGSFEPQYLSRTPMAVIWDGPEIIAFANLFLTDDKEEVSVDLMRYMPGRDTGVMDFLFVQLMRWAEQEGYRWFNLGMAPLSGLRSRPTAELWSRLGAMVFGHGERFYHFQGLRSFKDKFDPEWEARYLAVPSNVVLVIALANVASLISGGLSGVLRR